ncbi:MAG: twitching motility protein PilT, partial [Pyrinomonadaceae bacterium]|nr:twitching motility protein PilT [Pyrinomonadaceae bacterium]
QNGESEGKTLLDAMRDGKFDGMQHFDGVIKEMIEQKILTLEDGLAFATNQNNLLLELKGVSGKDDFVHDEPGRPGTATTTAPPRPQRSSSMFDLVEK